VKPTPLATPTLLSPADGSVFSNFPRTTTLRWAAVAGANRYVVERAFLSGGWAPYPAVTVSTTTFTFDFIGAQPGRWRVTAQDATGTRPSSQPSGWFGFQYTV
jgi:hypothetical protein